MKKADSIMRDIFEMGFIQLIDSNWQEIGTQLISFSSWKMKFTLLSWKYLHIRKHFIFEVTFSNRYKWQHLLWCFLILFWSHIFRFVIIFNHFLWRHWKYPEFVFSRTIYNSNSSFLFNSLLSWLLVICIRAHGLKFVAGTTVSAHTLDECFSSYVTTS